MLWGFPQALLVLVGAVPLILFLHSLKPKGVSVRTTTLFVWDRVVKERPFGTRLGWLLRKNLLLILQILAACLLALAIADPSLVGIGAPRGDLVVVLDLSASMKARGKTETRFDAARRELNSLIDSLSSTQRMMVIGAGAQPRLMAPFSGDKQRLKQLARELAASDGPGRVKEAILFAYSFLKRGSADRVVVISDGAFAGAETLSRDATHVQLVKVEGGRDNVAIVGFDVRRRMDRASEYEVFVRLRNYTEKSVKVPLNLTLGDKVIARDAVVIGPNESLTLIHPVTGRLFGTLAARLDISDDFSTDNQAFLSLEERTPLRTLYVGPGNPFLQSLFRFLPQLEVTTARSWDDAKRAPSDYDLIIFDRVPVPELSQGNFILIDTVAPNLPIRANGRVKTPRITVTDGNHPIAEGVNLADLQIREALRTAPAPDCPIVAKSAETPLMLTCERGKLRLFFIAFDVTASDLPLRVAFPVLFHNAFEWFQATRREFPGQTLQAGDSFAIRLAPTDDRVQVKAPSGKLETISALGTPVVFSDTFENGIYTYKSNSRAGTFAVSLLDEEESQIASRFSRLSTAAQKKADQSAVAAEAGFSLWPVLLSLVLILLGLELFLAFKGGLALSPVLVRCAAVAAAALALINPKIFQPTRALDVILSVDLSRSVGREARERTLEVLDAVRRLKPADTRTGVLAFGRSPEWEFLPREEFPIGDLMASPDREETDIQTALQAAASQSGEGRQEKILLISDGNENRGETARVIPLLRTQSVQVWTLPVTLSRGRNEIYLSDLRLPRQVDSGEAFELKAAVESFRPAEARIKLLRDGSLRNEERVHLVAGTNEVKFRETLTERGTHTYELLVESREDTLAENNILQGVVEVKGAPRVLVLSNEKAGQRFVARALRVQGYEVVESLPENESLTIGELSAFDLMVLDNVPAFKLSQGKMENIEKYVRDLGGGLLVIGGSQSYGAGGYYRTPLERVLPVDMRPPVRLDLPHVAIVFVLDKSGSMGAGPEGSTKLDLAKAAAIAAADVMNPTDQVGILAFDASWDWTLPFRAVGKGEWITDKLASVESDGGTDMYKALVEAYRAIARKEASIKHVLVLSDGLTDKMDFHSLITRMARDGITVSTVSVGNDADVQLMADIARDGKGRGYVALDPQTIPQIFTTESLLISRDLLVEKPVKPLIVSATGPLKGISQASLPPLRGYVLTYPKPRSELLMKADTDPLLVSWRYGLGRVIAFTSDLSGRWGKEWLVWSGLPQWTSQLARDALRRSVEGQVRSNFQADGEQVKVVTDVASADGKFLNHLNLRANLTTPNLTTSEALFRQIAPGRYEGRFHPGQRGIHFLTLYAQRKPGEENLPLATIPYISPYPKEYRELRPNIALLSRIAEETGGQMLDPDRLQEALKRLYTPTPGKSNRAREMWWLLAGAALTLFLGDLALRNVPRKTAA
ncbi:MAG TPA: VWA domain-containing protein [Candidatus Binatia bacterium]